jgi:hypothetical protein
MINLFNWLPALVRQFTFYCSDSPDPPDPDPLIGESALMQAEIGLEALDFYKQQYQENKPRQAAIDDAVIKAVQSQQAIAESNKAQGDEYYNYLKTTYRPLEQSIVDDANAYNVPAERERRAIAAGATVEQEIAAQRAAGERNLRSMGIRPDSGAATTGGDWRDIVGAAAKAGAVNQARDQAEQYGRALKMDAASLGRGLPGNAATAYGISTNASNSAVGNAGAGAGNARADAAMMGQGFQTALAGWGGAGSTALGGYNAQMQSYQAQQQQQGDIWGAVGMVAGSVLGGPIGGAIGGAVLGQKKADGGKIVGPGTGTSDSVSAINVDDGSPVQVSNGEYVIPEDVVRALGTKYFDKLLEKYHTPVDQQQGMADGGKVRPKTYSDSEPPASWTKRNLPRRQDVADPQAIPAYTHDQMPNPGIPMDAPRTEHRKFTGFLRQDGVDYPTFRGEDGREWVGPPGGFSGDPVEMADGGPVLFSSLPVARRSMRPRLWQQRVIPHWEAAGIQTKYPRVYQRMLDRGYTVQQAPQPAPAPAQQPQQAIPPRSYGGGGRN